MEKQTRFGSPSQRFWRQTKNAGPDECWEWVGSCHSNGYGYFYLSRDLRHCSAHRFSYELFVGKIPEGLQIDHLCFNRACVNPRHLEPVTASENIRRTEKGQRQECIHGHPLYGTNLYVETDSKGRTHRRCCECRREASRRKYMRYAKKRDADRASLTPS